MKSNEGLDCTPLIISGPSGTGKTTLIQMLLHKHSNRFGYAVSYTTRKMRMGEQNGVNFHYITPQLFQAMNSSHQFVQSVIYNNEQYATAKSEIEKVALLNKICILEVNMDGAKNIINYGLKPNFLYINCKSMDTLRERLEKRGTESNVVIEQRMKISIKEVEEANESGLFKNVVINEDLSNTLTEMENILTSMYKVI